MKICALHAPKEGSSEEQYEDAWATHTHTDGTTMLAVADGASTAVFAREWANLLVQTFVQGTPLPDDTVLFETVESLAKVWREDVESKATSWWAQEKLPHGSSATLLLAHRDKHLLQLLAIGDVCLFLVRNDRLKYAFPVTRSHKFDTRPMLLTTEKPAENPTVKRFLCEVEPRDHIYILSDAIACWFLEQYEAKRRPWDMLPSTNDELATWLVGLREEKTMKNDDVTIVFGEIA
jgi:serine/threonine protein phosphatase PrpC